MATTAIFPEGFVLADRYRIVRVIGQGGMGVVYLAEDIKLDNEQRAIKVIKPELLASPKSEKQLKNEAKSSLKLTHNNIVRILHYEESGGLSFIIMEYVDGVSLEKLIADKDKLSVEEFLQIGGQICNALAHAHDQGIIHQDIKPSNIFISQDGAAKLADFGIARAASNAATRMTGVLPSGTLEYMSPEMIRAKKPTIASDIYSLGITFYEMLNGETPFPFGDIGKAHLEETPENIENIPEPLNKAILSALNKNPADRPETVSKFWEKIHAVDEQKLHDEVGHKRREEEQQRQLERERKEEQRERRYKEVTINKPLYDDRPLKKRRTGDKNKRKQQPKEVMINEPLYDDKPQKRGESKKKFYISVIISLVLVIGFVLILQFNSNQNPPEYVPKEEHEITEEPVILSSDQQYEGLAVKLLESANRCWFQWWADGKLKSPVEGENLEQGAPFTLQAQSTIRLHMAHLNSVGITINGREYAWEELNPTPRTNEDGQIVSYMVEITSESLK